MVEMLQNFWNIMIEILNQEKSNPGTTSIDETNDYQSCILYCIQHLDADIICSLINYSDMIEYLHFYINPITESIATIISLYYNEEIYTFDEIVEYSRDDEGWPMLQLLINQFDIYKMHFSYENYLELLPIHERTYKEKLLIEEIFRKGSTIFFEKKNSF